MNGNDIIEHIENCFNCQERQDEQDIENCYVNSLAREKWEL